MNSGGSRKTTSSAYANIGGSRKQIFPLLQETIYTWNRYYKTSSSYETSSSVAQHGASFYDTEYVIDRIQYYISGTSFIITSANNAGLVPLGGNGYWITNSSESIPSSTGYLYRGGGFVWHYDNVYTNNSTLYVYTITTSYKKGSYINQVTSTNRNAYPDNNYSGSYWYEFVG